MKFSTIEIIAKIAIVIICIGLVILATQHNRPYVSTFIAAYAGYQAGRILRLLTDKPTS